MRLFDTHVHLNDPQLYPIRDELLNNAILLGIDKIIIIGFDLASSKLAVEIAHEYPNNCFAAIGIHPSELLKMGKDDIDEIRTLAKDNKVVAIGEIGYDFHWDDVSEEIQTRYFVEQIKIANENNLPIIIHSRDANNLTLETLKQNKAKLGGIMHCYAGSKEMVNDFISLGFYIAFGGVLTFKNARVSKEAIQGVPLNKLLFETDSPYLSPHPLRGTTNVPSNITLVLKEASNLLNIDENELSNITYNNSMEFIGLCKK